MAKRIVIERIFDAPREQVFEAWTNPKKIKKWWAPKGYDGPIIKIDLRKGGQYHYLMTGPNNFKAWSGGTFKEIKKNEKLVVTDRFEDEKGNVIEPSTFGFNDFPKESEVVIKFDKIKDNKTKLSITYSPKNEKEYNAMLKTGMLEGWNSSIDKLEDVVYEDRLIVLNRVINASQDKVFKAFGDKKNIVKWWGPNGFTTTTKKMNFKVGGTWEYIMHGPDGTDYPNRMKYLEINPNKIKYLHDSGKNNDPEGFISTVEFEKQENKTNVILKSVFPTAKQKELVIKKYGAIEGGKQTLGRLAKYVE
ncbi:MAG TPA: SRPBCC domain-containing protein [Alphaproteobacteria bacterium]|nr:SRPBCC domain-containing protein [Alphaproteobacteria bacterium]